MRRSVSLGLAVLAVALFAAPAGGQVPTGDSVTGSGTLTLVNINFAISVAGGPSGENPTGSLHVSTDNPGAPEFNFDATATCMNVSGTSATTGFRITSGPLTGGGFLVAFSDGGPDAGPVVSIPLDERPRDLPVPGAAACRCVPGASRHTAPAA